MLSKDVCGGRGSTTVVLTKLICSDDRTSSKARTKSSTIAAGVKVYRGRSNSNLARDSIKRDSRVETWRCRLGLQLWYLDTAIGIDFAYGPFFLQTLAQSCQSKQIGNAAFFGPELAVALTEMSNLPAETPWKVGMP